MLTSTIEIDINVNVDVDVDVDINVDVLSEVQKLREIKSENLENVKNFACHFWGNFGDRPRALARSRVRAGTRACSAAKN